MKKTLVFGLIVFSLMSCTYSQSTNSQMVKPKAMADNQKNNPVYSNTDTSKVELSEDEWKKILSPDVYYIARQKGTERPGTSPFEHSKEKGTYYCGACGNALFISDTKFDSGCGWPSFYQPVSKGSIIYTPDNTHGMTRTEVQCGRCKAHLGHVFDDGPPPTGLRYCINGVVLDFKKAQEAEKKFNSQ
ncbi:MAG TPA: peptide-methionine (R)-S-oxide reductase MsrB [Chitinophagaceae bacterium]